MKIYISGPITGLDMETVKENFRRADQMLNALGFDTVNPVVAQPEVQGKPWLEYMRDDIKLLVDCDGIFMLDGWRGSKGAPVERDLAKGLGLKVLYDTPTWEEPERPYECEYDQQEPRFTFGGLGTLGSTGGEERL